MSEILLQKIADEIKGLREQLADDDMAISAGAAAKFCGLGEKRLNTMIEAGVGPEFYDMPDGRKFTRRQLIRWRDGKFLMQKKWSKVA